MAEAGAANWRSPLDPAPPVGRQALWLPAVYRANINPEDIENLNHPREQNHIPSNRHGFEIAVNAARWVLRLARDLCKEGAAVESDMKNCWRVGGLVASMLALGFTSAMAQAPMQAYTPRTYECAANAHCSVFCQIDGEKQMQTGAAKTVTITPIAPNNYIVELVELNGHVQFLYLAGTKVVCNIDGLTRKAAE